MAIMLLAYDAGGNIMATLDYLVLSDEDGNPVGIVDFDAHEAAGGEHTDIWVVEGAAGSKSWPEWIGGRAHEFQVELAGPPGRKHIAALIHKSSRHRRERAAIDAGGPARTLILDDEGRTVRRTVPVLPHHRGRSSPESDEGHG